jgi:protein-S-isoprenylcysteine O-methyltransferase Ste14
VQSAASNPWWKGARGEWYVVTQFLLFAVIIFGPRTWPNGPRLSLPYARAWSIGGLLLIAAGAVLIATGGIWLGRNNVTALPHPRDEGTLVTTGPFRLVRHPVYSGGLFAAIGWAIWLLAPLTLGCAFALLLLLEVKSRKEERWLREKFPDYAAYQSRVRKLIPFVY